MTSGDFTISVTQEAVDVDYTPSVSSPRGKLFGFLFTICIFVALACALLFLPGKHGASSMWHSLAGAPLGSSGFLWQLLFLVFSLALFGWGSVRYARAAWASDETFHGDRNAITISRVPWLDFSNRTRRTRTYTLTEVHNIRFAVIASARGRQFWGLRFLAHGRKWTLPGLEAPDAKVILEGLRKLGADVPEDPKLQKRVDATLENRFGSTSWMDRSWMDHSSASQSPEQSADKRHSSEH